MQALTPEKPEMIVKRVSVPTGLEELMEGLTKEVILKKPKDLYLFASEYFSRLIILRDRKERFKASSVRSLHSVSKITPENKTQPLKQSNHFSRKLTVKGKSVGTARTSSIEDKQKDNSTKTTRRNLSNSLKRKNDIPKPTAGTISRKESKALSTSKDTVSNNIEGEKGKNDKKQLDLTGVKSAVMPKRQNIENIKSKKKSGVDSVKESHKNEVNLETFKLNEQDRKVLETNQDLANRNADSGQLKLIDNQKNQNKQDKQSGIERKNSENDTVLTDNLQHVNKENKSVEVNKAELNSFTEDFSDSDILAKSTNLMSLKGIPSDVLQTSDDSRLENNKKITDKSDIKAESTGAAENCLLDKSVSGEVEKSEANKTDDNLEKGVHQTDGKLESKEDKNEATNSSANNKPDSNLPLTEEVQKKQTQTKSNRNSENCLDKSVAEVEKIGSNKTDKKKAISIANGKSAASPTLTIGKEPIKSTTNENSFKDLKTTNVIKDQIDDNVAKGKESAISSKTIDKQKNGTTEGLNAVDALGDQKGNDCKPAVAAPIIAEIPKLSDDNKVQCITAASGNNKSEVTDVKLTTSLNSEAIQSEANHKIDSVPSIAQEHDDDGKTTRETAARKDVKESKRSVIENDKNSMKATKKTSSKEETEVKIVKREVNGSIAESVALGKAEDDSLKQADLENVKNSEVSTKDSTETKNDVCEKNDENVENKSDKTPLESISVSTEIRHIKDDKSAEKSTINDGNIENRDVKMQKELLDAHHDDKLEDKKEISNENEKKTEILANAKEKKSAQVKADPAIHQNKTTSALADVKMPEVDVTERPDIPKNNIESKDNEVVLTAEPARPDTITESARETTKARFFREDKKLDFDKSEVKENDKTIPKDAGEESEQNVVLDILNLKMSQNQPGLLDKQIKSYLDSFINAEQLNIFRLNADVIEQKAGTVNNMKEENKEVLKDSIKRQGVERMPVEKMIETKSELLSHAEIKDSKLDGHNSALTALENNKITKKEKGELKDSVKQQVIQEMPAEKIEIKPELLSQTEIKDTKPDDHSLSVNSVQTNDDIVETHKLKDSQDPIQQNNSVNVQNEGDKISDYLEIIKNIITLRMSVDNTGFIDQPVKNALNGFLTSEQNNVFVKSEILPPSAQKKLSIKKQDGSSMSLGSQDEKKDAVSQKSEQIKKAKSVDASQPGNRSSIGASSGSDLQANEQQLLKKQISEGGNVGDLSITKNVKDESKDAFAERGKDTLDNSTDIEQVTKEESNAELKGSPPVTNLKETNRLLVTNALLTNGTSESKDSQAKQTDNDCKARASNDKLEDVNDRNKSSTESVERENEKTALIRFEENSEIHTNHRDSDTSLELKKSDEKGTMSGQEVDRKNAEMKEKKISESDSGNQKSQDKVERIKDTTVPVVVDHSQHTTDLDQNQNDKNLDLIENTKVGNELGKERSANGSLQNDKKCSVSIKEIGNVDRMEKETEIPTSNQNESNKVNSLETRADSKENSALKIQSLWRGFQVRKANLNKVSSKTAKAIVLLQSMVRGYLQRKKYKIQSSLETDTNSKDSPSTQAFIKPDLNRTEEVVNQKLVAPLVADVPLKHEEVEVVRTPSSREASKIHEILTDQHIDVILKHLPDVPLHEIPATLDHTKDFVSTKEHSEDDNLTTSSVDSVESVITVISNTIKHDKNMEASAISQHDISISNQVKNEHSTVKLEEKTDDTKSDKSNEKNGKNSTDLPMVINKIENTKTAATTNQLIKQKEMEHTDIVKSDDKNNEKVGTRSIPDPNLESTKIHVNLHRKESHEELNTAGDVNSLLTNNNNNTGFMINQQNAINKLNDAIDDHVDLLDQVQNTLLDQICGKPVSTIANKQFEYEELHKAARPHQSENDTTHHHLQRDNNDELLQYLTGFESAGSLHDTRINCTPNRELADILEEDITETNDSKTNLNDVVVSTDCAISSLANESQQMAVPNGQDKMVKVNETDVVDRGSQTAIQQQPSSGTPKSNNAMTSLPSTETYRKNDTATAHTPLNHSHTNNTSHANAGSNPKTTMDVFQTIQSSMSATSSPSQFVKNREMESESNNNNNINKRNNAFNCGATGPKMEDKAATRIQAGFRGYQVRKQLKAKKSSNDKITNQKRSTRRKGSGSDISKKNIDLEEKSAVKIQAGVRGFLVRRRQKKQIVNSSSA